MAQSDKASDYESEDWGFKSLQGLPIAILFIYNFRHDGYIWRWIRINMDVPVAQWIAHQTSNLGVAGSNPVGYFCFLPDKNVRDAVFQCVVEVVFASIAQLAEHLPRKQKVSSLNLYGGCRAVGLEV